MNGNFKTLIAIAAATPPYCLYRAAMKLSSPPRVKVKTLYR